MYDELVKQLRTSVDGRYEKCDGCPYEEDYPCCVDCLDKMHKQAADAIEELQKAVNFHKFNSEFWEDKYNSLADEKWIPVTERLPEFEDAVLCMRKSNVYGVRPHQEILYVDEYGFKNYDDIYLADGVVTHWMPLPEPPKEE